MAAICIRVWPRFRHNPEPCARGFHRVAGSRENDDGASESTRIPQPSNERNRALTLNDPMKIRRIPGSQPPDVGRSIRNLLKHGPTRHANSCECSDRDQVDSFVDSLSPTATGFRVRGRVAEMLRGDLTGTPDITDWSVRCSHDFLTRFGASRLPNHGRKSS
jgi:hypothetical protein